VPHNPWPQLGSGIVSHLKQPAWVKCTPTESAHLSGLTHGRLHPAKPTHPRSAASSDVHAVVSDSQPHCRSISLVTDVRPYTWVTCRRLTASCSSAQDRPRHDHETGGSDRRWPRAPEGPAQDQKPDQEEGMSLALGLGSRRGPAEPELGTTARDSTRCAREPAQ
jgi:hypothetical protein